MSIADGLGCCDEVDGEISSSSGNTYPVDGKNNSFWIKKRKKNFLFANLCKFLHVFFQENKKMTIAII